MTVFNGFQADVNEKKSNFPFSLLENWAISNSFFFCGEKMFMDALFWGEISMITMQIMSSVLALQSTSNIQIAVDW